jgi:type I restriction enzyme, S subunit
VSQYQKTQLQNITTKIGSGATPRGGNSVYKQSGISLIRSQNVYDFEFKVDGLAYIDEKQAARLANVEVQPNDVLLNITGDSIGRCCIVPNEYLPARVNQHVAIIRANHLSVPRFLLYYINAPRNKTDILNRVHGGTRRALTKGIIEALEIELPPLPIQQRIAEILGRLDDKIEVNRRINRTLEAMAQALYKEWFVDFGPFQDGEFVESELGLIPKGWGVGKVADFGQIVTGKTPPTKEETYFGDEIPFIKIPDMHGQVFIIQTSSRLSKIGAESQGNKYIPAGSICVSCIATAGLVCLTSEPSQTNQQINSIVPLNDSWAEFIYCQMSVLGDHIRLLGSGGSATLNLNKNDFSNIRVLLPPNNVVAQFHVQVAAWFSQILNCYQESRQLAATRDYLLPRLLSGALSVAAGEEMAGGVPVGA